MAEELSETQAAADAAMFAEQQRAAALADALATAQAETGARDRRIATLEIDLGASQVARPPPPAPMLPPPPATHPPALL